MNNSDNITPSLATTGFAVIGIVVYQNWTRVLAKLKETAIALIYLGVIVLFGIVLCALYRHIVALYNRYKKWHTWLRAMYEDIQIMKEEIKELKGDSREIFYSLSSFRTRIKILEKELQELKPKEKEEAEAAKDAVQEICGEL